MSFYSSFLGIYITMDTVVLLQILECFVCNMDYFSDTYFRTFNRRKNSNRMTKSRARNSNMVRIQSSEKDSSETSKAERTDRQIGRQTHAPVTYIIKHAYATFYTVAELAYVAHLHRLYVIMQP